MNVLVKSRLRMFLIAFFVKVNMMGVTMNKMNQFIMREITGMIIMKMIKLK